MPFELLKIGLIEPNFELFGALLGKISDSSAEVPLQATNTKFALQLIRDTKVKDLAGAFIGNLGGSLREMQSVLNAMRDKYPQAYLIAMVQSPKFKFTNHDYTIHYEDLTNNSLNTMMSTIRRVHLEHLGSNTE